VHRFVRIVPRICRSALASPISAYEESRIPLRVGTFEADYAFAHQSMAPLYFELGRWDLALRCGLARWMLRNRCAGILGGQFAKYHRPLKRFRKYDLVTQLAAWDEKWLYIAHRIEREDRVYVSGGVRLLFVDQRGQKLTPQDALTASGAEPRPSPDYPAARFFD
jgi:acyl-CoA thioesterase FadM